MSEPDPVSPAATSKGAGRGKWYAIGAAALVAVVGATASAVITPERVDWFFGLFSGGQTATEFKTVSTRDGAITVDVPLNWLVAPGKWNQTAHPGTGIVAGTVIDGPVTGFVDDGAYLAASSEFAKPADLAGMSESETRDTLTEVLDLDWTIQNCVRDTDVERSKRGWIVESTKWKDCRENTGQRLYEFAAVDADGTVLVIGQVSLVPGTPDVVVDRFFESFIIDVDELPVFEVPHPSFD